MAVPQNLRYSPVNWLIVDWGFNGQAFDNCGLPKPVCPAPKSDAPAACRTLPIGEAINTYDWERWLPEVIVGIDDPDEEIAANYVRESTIEFCRDARILQREVVVELQPNETVYPVFPYDAERIVGVLGTRLDGCAPCCDARQFSRLFGLDYRLDTARNELHVQGSCRAGELLRVLVWSTPTEDACEHDQFIYDSFRRDITLGARLRYVRALHFRDTALMRSLPSELQWDQAIISAKRRAVNVPSARQEQPGSGMWQTGCRGRGGW